MKINTVNGTAEARDLGMIIPHEHIFLDLTAFFNKHAVPGIGNPESEPVKMEHLGALRRDPYALKDNLLMTDYETQRRELSFLKAAGAGTVVDLTLPGIGRNPKLLQRISADTGLNIVMGTGFYVADTHPQSLAAMSDKQAAQLMIKEITDGADGTDIKAGIIGEIGISERFNDAERKVLRAAALAHLATGAPVNVHINPWTTAGTEAADILINAGVKPGAICISHIDVQNNETYINKLVDKGVYIEFDNFGKEFFVRKEVRNSGYGLFVTDSERVSLIKKLVDRGYLKQLLLSCDVCLKNLLRTYGGWGYDHVLTNIVPMLAEAGIPARDIEIILKRNPAEFLTGDK